MRRDYKEIFNNKPIRYQEDVEDDLIADQPNEELYNILNYILDDARNCVNEPPDGEPDDYICHFNSLSDEQIMRFCDDYKEYEYWAKLTITYLDFNKKMHDDRINILEKANFIITIFNYLYEKIKPSFLLKNYTNNTKKINNQEKTLLDVVDELPEFDKEHFTEQFEIAYIKIDNWVEEESAIWENDILTKIPNDKIGMYLYGKMNDLLDLFHDFVPYTREDWEKMKQGDGCFYCMAMEHYYSALCSLCEKYDINEDEHTKKINEYCWFLSDIDVCCEDDGNYEDSPQPQGKSFKEFFEEVTDYLQLHEVNEHKFCWKKIDEWIKYSIKKIEDDFVTVKNEKMSLYLFNIVHNIHDECREYFPTSYDEFTAGQHGKRWYYYDGLLTFFDYLSGVIHLHGIKEDRYIRMINDMTKYFANEEDLTEGDEPEENLRDIYDTQPSENTEQSDTSLPLSEDIDSYILADDTKAFKSAMTKLLKGTKGKKAAFYVMGAVSNNYLNKPTFDILQLAFGITGSKQAFNNYYDDKRSHYDNKKTQKEVDDAKEKVKQTYEEMLKQ